jgi:hypothetical protein
LPELVDKTAERAGAAETGKQAAKSAAEAAQQPAEAATAARGIGTGP